MKLKRYFRRSILSLWAISLLVLTGLAVVIIQREKAAEVKRELNELQELALALTAEIRSFPQLEDRGLTELLLTQARLSGIRITLIEGSGRVAFDSEKEATALESHRYRPEIYQALSGQIGFSSRYSDTLKKMMFYVAVPVRRDSQIIGACRVSRDLDLAAMSYHQSRRYFLAFFVLGLILSWVLIYFSLKRLFKPLEELSSIINQAEMSVGEEVVGTSLLKELGELAGGVGHLISQKEELSSHLKQQQEILSGWLEASGEGWLLLDQDGKIVLASDSLKQMFPDLEFSQKFYWQAMRWPELKTLLEEARTTSKPVQQRLERAGRFYSLSVGWLPAQQHFLLRFSDLTEVIDLARKKQEFQANLIHELKTPLTAISGFLETLEEENLSSEGKAHLDIIKRNIRRLNRLIEDLARLSELEEKPQELEVEQVNLAELVQRVAHIYESQATKKGLSLEIEAEPLVTLEADSFLLEQLVINLVDNALRYTEQGGVKISLRNKNDGVELQVSDTGIGLAEEHLSRIFERFYVVDKSRSRKTGGTGLGLAIVKHIVLLHQGKITVTSAPGVGTTFTVWLPKEQSARTDEK
ncbi:MAG TPA: ATP-binding protein [Candidatus Saccharicenans sp.]|nr:ATP-binding protein [Candidatus Saccharicenans sp.]HQH60488.1 ATP-binding protein [Candidatus Saccharicenans sp.]HQI21788.1 ATP-binding protein [Candidatus Saccharicenans sp.]